MSPLGSVQTHVLLPLSPAPLHGFGGPPSFRRALHSHRFAFILKRQAPPSPDLSPLCVALSAQRPGQRGPGECHSVSGHVRFSPLCSLDGPEGAVRGAGGPRCARRSSAPRGCGKGLRPLLGAGVAECVRENTLRTSAPQVLGHWAQGPRPGSPPLAEVSWRGTTLSLSQCPWEEAAHVLEGAS